MIGVQAFGKGGNKNGGVVYTGARGKGEGIIKMFDCIIKEQLLFFNYIKLISQRQNIRMF